MIRLRHILLSVNDLKESEEWYRKNLGFEVQSEFYVPPTESDCALITNGTLTLELACFRGGAKPLPEERRLPKTDVMTVGTKQFGLLTDNMQALLGVLRDNGSEIVYTADMGADIIAMIRDCNGIVIELVEQKTEV